MKAITTKYHGPTNTRGSRISASDLDKNRVSLSYDDALNSEENHDAAAKALCIKMNWTRYPLMRGSNKDGNVYVFDVADSRVLFTNEELERAKPARKPHHQHSADAKDPR